MYLQPWQIFVSGIFVGIVISIIVLTVFIIRVGMGGGVRIDKIDNNTNIKKEEDNNGRE